MALAAQSAAVSSGPALAPVLPFSQDEMAYAKASNYSFEEINGVMDALKSDRKNWDILWDEVARYVIQRKGNILTRRSPGEKQTQQIYDTTADKANKIFAAGLVSHICPAGEKWVRIEPKNPRASAASREWHSTVSDILLDLIYASNYYRAIHEDFMDAGAFNTSAMLVEEGKKYPFNFVNIPVGYFGIDEDAEGNVDTFYREWKWTARQAIQKWGIDRLGKQVRQAAVAKGSAANKKFTFRHLVRPRLEGVIAGLAEPQARPFASFYVCLEDKNIIEEGGYYEFPYPTSRLLKSNDEVYGRGPGTDCMPEIKMVNAMERDLLIAHEKMTNPGWLLPSDANYRPDNRPNSVMYWDTSNALNKPEQIELKNRVDLGEQKTAQKRKLIEEAFYVPMFQMLTTLDEQRREKTAYEVQQMIAEKLVLFSPLFARMCEEKLNPIIERCLGIAGRLGYLPPPPPEVLQDGQYQIVYTSKIALAIKSAENQSFATMIQLAMSMSQLDPSVVDVVKWRDAYRRTGSNVAFPSKLMRTDKEVDDIQAKKMQAEQQQQQAETADTAASAAQKLGPGAQKLAVEKMQKAAESN